LRSIAYTCKITVDYSLLSLKLTSLPLRSSLAHLWPLSALSQPDHIVNSLQSKHVISCSRIFASTFPTFPRQILSGRSLPSASTSFLPKHNTTPWHLHHNLTSSHQENHECRSKVCITVTKEPLGHLFIKIQFCLRCVWLRRCQCQGRCDEELTFVLLRTTLSFLGLIPRNWYWRSWLLSLSSFLDSLFDDFKHFNTIPLPHRRCSFHHFPKYFEAWYSNIEILNII
jgi:hypothetical protein